MTTATATRTYPAHRLPLMPGYPETPVTVIGPVAWTNPVRCQIRIDGSGVYCPVDEDRLRFAGPVAAQRQFEAQFTDHAPKTDVAAALAALASTR